MELPTESRSTTISQTVQRVIRSIPLEEFEEEILAEFNTVSPKSVQSFTMLFRILRQIGITETNSLTNGAVAKLINAHPAHRSRETLKVRLSFFKTLCARAERSGYLSESPFRVRPLSDWIDRQEPPSGVRHTPLEIRTLLDHLAQDACNSTGRLEWSAMRLYALTAAFAYLGSRADETFRLRLNQVDFGNSVVRFGARLCKLARHPKVGRSVPIPDPYIPILRRWIEVRAFGLRDRKDSCPWLFPNRGYTGFWWSGGPGQKPRCRISDAARCAGIPGLTPSSLARSIIAPWWQR
jgi:integrase